VWGHWTTIAIDKIYEYWNDSSDKMLRLGAKHKNWNVIILKLSLTIRDYIFISEYTHANEKKKKYTIFISFQANDWTIIFYIWYLWSWIIYW
jgi:hypothetical protein